MRAVLAGALLLALATAAAASPTPFDATTFERLRDDHAGRALIVAFWSIDCPPCHRELTIWGELARRHPGLAIHLVSTDPWPAREEVARVARERGAGALPGWIFAAGADPALLRRAIDRRWRGELPRTYLFAPDGSVAAHSGVIEAGQVIRWLERHGRR